MIEVTVDLTPIRVGLKAIVPHVARSKDLAALQTLRFHLGHEYLTLSATDGFTTAAAVLLPVVEHGPDGEVGTWDMTARDAKDLLTLFPVTRDTDENQTSALRFRVDEDTIEIQDVGGLFEGKRVTLPSHDVDDFPDLPAALAVVLEDAARPKVDGFTLPANGLGKFLAAADAYGELDVFVLPRKAAAKTTFVIRGGNRFIGMLRGHDDDADLTAVQQAWLDRLPSGGPSLDEVLDR